MFSANYLKNSIEKNTSDKVIINKISKGNTIVFLGNSNEFIKKYGNKNYKNESFDIFQEGNFYYINGKQPDGLFYAVVSFLESWYNLYMMEDGRLFVNKNSRPSFNSKLMSFSPPFEMRFVAYFEVLKRNYASFNKALPLTYFNYLYDELNFKYYCKQDCGWGHTAFCMIPPEKYMQTMPFLFAQDKEGKVVTPARQLCFSNDTVYKLVNTYLQSVMAQYPQNKFFSVTNNDGIGTCECPRCTKTNKQENSSSGTIVRLINRLAKENRRRYPDLKYITLSYLDLKYGPQLTKLDQDAYVCISVDTSGWDYPFRKIRDSRHFQQRMNSWKKCTNNIYVWDYTCDFDDYLLIRPNIDIISDNLRFYAEMGVKGVYLQSFYENGNVEESLLRPFIWSHLIWNPQESYRDYLKIFVENYYGSASKDIMRYYDFIYQNRKMSISSNYILDLDNYNVKKLVNIVEAVKAKQKGDEMNDRILKWRMPIIYSLVKYQSYNLTPKQYFDFSRELQKDFEKFEVDRLSNFNKRPQDFIDINLKRSEGFYKKMSKSFSIKENEVDGSMLRLHFDTRTNTKPELVEDKDTESGLSVSLGNTSPEHLIEFRPSVEFINKFHGREIKVRLKGKLNNDLKTENKLYVGVYSLKESRMMYHSVIPKKDISEKYKTINLGALPLEENTILIFYNLPGSLVQNFNIDKLIF